MKKLEKLKSKGLEKKTLSSVLGALIAPDYTIYSTGCTHSNNTPAYDCSDETRDKDK